MISVFQVVLVFLLGCTYIDLFVLALKPDPPSPLKKGEQE
jgi:hypothetical protein